MNENSIDAVFFLSLSTLICGSVTLLIRYCYKSKCSEFECLCFKLKEIHKLKKKKIYYLMITTHQN